MKLGLSSYSLSRAIGAGEMNIADVINWIAEQGGQHVEIVPIGFELTGNPELVEHIRKTAEAAGIEVSNYAIGAQFLQPTREDFKREVERVKEQVDIAAALGVKLMRHDVASLPPAEATDERFERDLPALVEACAIISEYAEQYGITTSVENHGYYIQAHKRVQRLVAEVNRPNFRTTLDIGNFMCADENSVEAVRANIGIASMVHIKDFYLRGKDRNPGEGWFRTAAGNYLRGAIAGHGDIDLYEVLRIVKSSGYDGYLSLEFEGMEDCRTGSRIGLANVARIWNEV